MGLGGWTWHSEMVHSHLTPHRCSRHLDCQARSASHKRGRGLDRLASPARRKARSLVGGPHSRGPQVRAFGMGKGVHHPPLKDKAFRVGHKGVWESHAVPSELSVGFDGGVGVPRCNHAPLSTSIPP